MIRSIYVLMIMKTKLLLTQDICRMYLGIETLPSWLFYKMLSAKFQYDIIVILLLSYMIMVVSRNMYKSHLNCRPNVNCKKKSNWTRQRIFWHFTFCLQYLLFSPQINNDLYMIPPIMYPKSRRLIQNTNMVQTYLNLWTSHSSR